MARSSNPEVEKPGDSRAWSELLRWIKRFREVPSFEEDERTYKLEIAARVNEAREHFQSGTADWKDPLRHAFTRKPNNLTDYRTHDRFLKWMDPTSALCRSALQALWSAEGPPEERLQSFCNHVSPNGLKSLGERLNVGTFLLMAEDATRLPPVKIGSFRKVWKLAGRGKGPPGSEPGAVYSEILRFLDDLVRDSRSWPIPLYDRLDAQGAVWSLTKRDNSPRGWPSEDWTEFVAWREGKGLVKQSPSPSDYTLVHARQDLFLSEGEIESFIALLKRKKNLVLQGPPGTGKTYVAQRLGWLPTGERSTDRIEAVQFHQSYGYEDFVHGYRPNAAGGFDLQDGPFLSFCARAREVPDWPYVLIVDEINRGNLSRIFGELLMLIEADKRDPEWALRTAYARPDEPAFHVPANLHLIGTMNTADRSIALVDYALRRRFAFATVAPAFRREGFTRHLVECGVPEPVSRRIKDRFEALNERIRKHLQLGEGFQIGHSYFCRPPEGLADDTAWNDWYTDVVRYEIDPLLREYWFDDTELAGGALDALLAAE